MAANPDNVPSFIVTSDYPMEKVVYLESGSFTLPASSSQYFHSFAHELPFTPLVGGGWSLVSDFSTQHNYGSGTLPANTPSRVYAQELDIFADDTSVYLVGWNDAATDKTIYYRVFGLQPTTDESVVPHTVSRGDQFNLNSDYALLKVFKAGYEDLPATSGTEYSVDVPHESDYWDAMALGWQTADTYNGTTTVTAIHPNDSTYLSGNNAIFVVPTGNNPWVTIVNREFMPATRFHYRLYL